MKLKFCFILLGFLSLSFAPFAETCSDHPKGADSSEVQLVDQDTASQLVLTDHLWPKAEPRPENNYPEVVILSNLDMAVRPRPPSTQNNKQLLNFGNPPEY